MSKAPRPIDPSCAGIRRIESNGLFGYKSPFGNASVARLVATAIAKLGVLLEQQAK
jgi:hypothetical protein